MKLKFGWFLFFYVLSISLLLDHHTSALDHLLSAMVEELRENNLKGNPDIMLVGKTKDPNDTVMSTSDGVNTNLGINCWLAFVQNGMLAKQNSGQSQQNFS